MRNKTCVVCETGFQGGARARYCASCRIKREKERNREHRLRKKRGTGRLLGSTDNCENCSAAYVIASGTQRYCRPCAPEVAAKIQRRQLREHAEKNRASINEILRTRRRTPLRQCSLCKKEFEYYGNKSLCSDECVAKARKIHWARSNAKRSRKNRDIELPLPPRKIIDWSQVDFSRPVKEIAKELGVRYGTVWINRKKQQGE